MSTFSVTVEQIERVWNHANADRLELASLTGMTYQFCVPKGEYAPGDTVIYFPIDSLLPALLIETLGLAGKLHGKNKDRIATVKLRGEISQGVVARPDSVLPPGITISQADLHTRDLSEVFGVMKYEPPEVSIKEGKLVALPPLVGVYDIEGADRFPHVIDLLLDQPVVVTEKIEGSHFSASLDENGSIAICQRRHRIIADEGQSHDWHTAAERERVGEALRRLWELTQARQIVTLRGEIVGPSIQANIYDLKERAIYFFEVEVDGQHVEADKALSLIQEVGLKTVPVLACGRILREYLGGQSVTEASTGKTALPDAPNPDMWREGIVIRPMYEQSDPEFGRLIIKQRSPIYLEWSGL